MIVEKGDRILRARYLEPALTERGHWLIRTDGEHQTRLGLAVFVAELPEHWDYIEITGMARSGKAAFGVAKPLCKCQRSDGFGTPDLGDCVCDEIDKPTAYVVVCSNWDKCWSWAGHATSPEDAEHQAAALAPWVPKSYSTMRANKAGVCASIWRDKYDG